MGFITNLDSHKFNHANSEIILKPNILKLRNETRYNNELLKEMASIYARLINQYKSKYQTVFSASFDEQGENGQMSDEIELYINWNINRNLTESDNGNIDFTSALGNRIQKPETKDSGWRFDKVNSKTSYFKKLLKWMVQVR